MLTAAGRDPITVSGTLTGAGTLAIPAGVWDVTLTGIGGLSGGTYDPGQPYIEPTGYHAAVPAADAVWGEPWQWFSTDSPSRFIQSPHLTDSPIGYVISSTYPTSDEIAVHFGQPSALSPSTDDTNWFRNWSNNYGQRYYQLVPQTVYPHLALIAAAHGIIPAYYDDPGQPYIEPHLTNQTVGIWTQFSMGSDVHTFYGGTPGFLPRGRTDHLYPWNTAQTIYYSVAESGSLSYSYTY